MSDVRVIMLLEGVNLASGLIVRELTLYFPSLPATRHYFFTTPSDLTLTHGDRVTERYHAHILGGIALREIIPGALEYKVLYSILQSIRDMEIQVVGSVAYTFLKYILPNSNIIDLQRHNSFKFPSALQPANCGHMHQNPRYCTLAKLWILRAHLAHE